MSKPRVFWEYQPIRTLTKYFDDGTIEVWLTNDDNEELYLIKSIKHPSGKSPVVQLGKQKDEL